MLMLLPVFYQHYPVYGGAAPLWSHFGKTSLSFLNFKSLPPIGFDSTWRNVDGAMRIMP